MCIIMLVIVMHLKNIIEKYDKKVIMYVDMDGVIADYEVGKALDFKNKRPLLSNINKLKDISNISNIEMHILSLCKKDYQVKDKNDWLDKYAPFFKKENRVIISKESNEGTSCELKANYLSKLNFSDDNVIVMIDDDNSVLYYIMENVENIVLFQDSSLVD